MSQKLTSNLSIYRDSADLLQIDNTKYINCWKFNEGSGSVAYDTLNAYPLYCNGNVSWTSGKLNSCINLDGTTYWYSTDGQDFQPGVGDFAWCGWVYTPTTSAKFIFAKSSYIDPDNKLALSLDASNHLVFQAGVTTGTSSSILPTSTWCFVWCRRLGPGTNNCQAGWTTDVAGAFNNTPAVQFTDTSSVGVQQFRTFNTFAIGGQAPWNDNFNRVDSPEGISGETDLYYGWFGYSNNGYSAAWVPSGARLRILLGNGLSRVSWAYRKTGFSSSIFPVTIQFTSVRDNMTENSNDGISVGGNVQGLYTAGPIDGVYWYWYGSTASMYVGDSTGQLATVAFARTSNVTYNVKVEITSTTVRAKMWQVGTGEPGGWTITGTRGGGLTTAGSKFYAGTHDSSSFGSDTNWYMDDLYAYQTGQVYFDGKIDQVIWANKYGFSNGELASFWNGGAGRESVPLITTWDINQKINSKWEFNEGSGTIARDSMGAHDLTATGAPSWGTGKLNGCTVLNGTSQYWSVGDSVDFESGYEDFTFCGWYYLNSASYPLAYSCEMVCKSNWNDATDRFKATLFTDGALIIYVGPQQFANTTAKFPLQQWTFFWFKRRNGIVTAGWNDTTIPKFIGIEYGSVGVNAISFRVGVGTSTQYWIGSIDQCIWCRAKALSGAELAGLYNSGSGTQEVRSNSSLSNIPSTPDILQRLVSGGDNSLYNVNTAGVNRIANLRLGGLWGYDAGGTDGIPALCACKYTAVSTGAVSNIVVRWAQVSAGATGTRIRFGIYTHNDAIGCPGTLLAETSEYITKGNNCVSGEGDSIEVIPLQKSCNLVAGQRYWIAFLYDQTIQMFSLLADSTTRWSFGQWWSSLNSVSFYYPQWAAMPPSINVVGNGGTTYWKALGAI